MIVWLASYPRSGNRFFRTQCSQRYGLLARDKTLPVPESAPGVEEMRTLEVAAQSKQVVIVKTHELPTPDRFPTVYLLRDGRDSLVSYAHFALTIERKMRPEEITPQLFHDTLRNLILETRSPYGTWSTNVKAWLSRPGVVLIRYEDMVKNASGEIDRAIASLGLNCPLVTTTLPTFQEMKAVDQRLVRRGVVGSWKDEFPQDLLPLFWEHNGDVMRQCGYADGA
jgi:hypothetical protein